MPGYRMKARRMKTLRIVAIAVLAITAFAVLFANYLAPAGYEQQFRELPQAGPSAHHLLGTDELGRDRWARLLYGMRVSLPLAPLAALFTTFLAGLVGGLAGYFGGWTERCCKLLIDLFLSVPWLFLLITVRAVLPLNVSPEASVTVKSRKPLPSIRIPTSSGLWLQRRSPALKLPIPATQAAQMSRLQMLPAKHSAAAPLSR